MPFKHLLVPSDGSDLSGHAVQQALELAGSLGARVTFLHARAHGPVPVLGMGEMLDARTMNALLEASLRDSSGILEQAAEAARAAGIDAACEQVVHDVPHRAIIEAAARLGCDLIVMASHGRRGLGGLLLGSETQRVLVQASCPVLVVR